MINSSAINLEDARGSLSAVMVAGSGSANGPYNRYFGPGKFSSKRAFEEAFEKELRDALARTWKAVEPRGRPSFHSDRLKALREGPRRRPSKCSTMPYCHPVKGARSSAPSKTHGYASLTKKKKCRNYLRAKKHENKFMSKVTKASNYKPKPKNKPPRKQPLTFAGKDVLNISADKLARKICDELNLDALPIQREPDKHSRKRRLSEQRIRAKRKLHEEIKKALGRVPRRQLWEHGAKAAQSIVEEAHLLLGEPISPIQKIEFLIDKIFEIDCEVDSFHHDNPSLTVWRKGSRPVKEPRNAYALVTKVVHTPATPTVPVQEDPYPDDVYFQEEPEVYTPITPDPPESVGPPTITESERPVSAIRRVRGHLTSLNQGISSLVNTVRGSDQRTMPSEPNRPETPSQTTHYSSRMTSPDERYPDPVVPEPVSSDFLIPQDPETPDRSHAKPTKPKIKEEPMPSMTQPMEGPPTTKVEAKTGSPSKPTTKNLRQSRRA